MFNGTAWSLPTTNVPDLKVGFDLQNSSTKVKLLSNLRSFVTEGNFTYLARSNFALGANYVLDVKTQNLEKYDFGLSWSPADNAFVGLKHESTSKDSLSFGRFFLYF